jgi:hypothetical protein
MKFSQGYSSIPAHLKYNPANKAREAGNLPFPQQSAPVTIFSWDSPIGRAHITTGVGTRSPSRIIIRVSRITRIIRTNRVRAFNKLNSLIRGAAIPYYPCPEFRSIPSLKRNML